jgi:hypothetical protein
MNSAALEAESEKQRSINKSEAINEGEAESFRN